MGKEYNFFKRAKDWVLNKLTEMSIAQIPNGYSEDDDKLLKKYDSVLTHIRNKDKRLAAAKMIESQTTNYNFTPVNSLNDVWNSLPPKVEEKKLTKTQQIMDFLAPGKIE